MKKYIFSLLLAVIFTACSGDFLNIENPNKMTGENFWKSEKDFDEALLACYGSFYFGGTFNQWYDLVFEMRADLCWNESAWRDYANFSKFQPASSNWECIRYCWNDYYKGIAMFNKFLAHIDDVNVPMDDTVRKHYKGEVSFLRAFFYFNLYHLYGCMPIITEPADEVFFPANATEDEIWSQILSDLNVALLAGLPDTRPEGDLGRVTNGAVLAMIGKSYMQRHEWQKAGDAFKKIIDSNLYQLVDEYSDNFDKDHEYNSESIFEIAFSEATRGDWTTYGTSKSPSTTQRARYFAPRSVGGHSDAQPNYFYLNEFTDKTVDGKQDPRKRASIIYYPTQKLYGKTYLQLGGSADINPDQPIIWCAKYSNGTWRDFEDDFSPINLRIIRYADVLLMYAEALNNQGLTNEAYPWIDKVRTRKSVNLKKLADIKPNMSQQEMQEQIEHERICELGGESVRWFDIFRWGYLDTEEGKTKMYAHDYEFKTFRPGIDKFLPIPQQDIDLNPNFKPNTGF